MRIFSRRHRDLQPWLDYFRMLQAYEAKGLLEVMPEKHEAYVIQTALLAMTPDGTGPMDQLVNAVPVTMRRIRAYAGWLSREGEGYMDRNFALHVVGDDGRHDLKYTMLATRRRVWWKLWRKADLLDVITYE